MRFRVTWLLAVFVSFTFPFHVMAEGKKPDKKESHPVRDAKDKTNSALNNFDSGLHDALHQAKDAGNKALNAVDHGVHTAIDDLRQPSKKPSK